MVTPLQSIRYTISSPAVRFTLIHSASGYLPKDVSPFRATAFEKRLVLAYREHPEVQSAVNKLLELD